MAHHSCPTGKQVHYSRGKADAHLRQLKRNGEYSGRVYPCIQCGGFHVGREKRSSHKSKYQRKGETK